MRRPLPTPDIASGRLRATDRVDDLGELHARKPRQDVPPEQLRVVDRIGIGPVPLGKRSLTGRDGGTAPATDLWRLCGVGVDANLAADVARVRDSPTAVGTGPQRKSGRLDRKS